MHPKNPYSTRKPDFAALADKYSDLQPFVATTSEGYASIDFSNAAALRALTRCLLKEDWQLDVELREDRLCPTVANRLDYLFHVLDLEPFLGVEPGSSSQRIKTPLRVLDIGTGSMAIYAILLHRLRPNARMIGTELDQVSFNHAQSTILANDIPRNNIELRQLVAEDKVLFPLFDSGKNEMDIVICNPPFFSSEDEMIENQAMKAEGAPAAPTAAINELVTFGGEVTFVSRMIKESLELRNCCRWYTSLIGRFASLQPLVELLKRNEVDNYFIKTIKPSRTVRWVLAWSYTAIRIPDEITRPEPIYPNTAFSRIAPPPNTVSHCPVHPALSVEQLKAAVWPVLESIQLNPTPYIPPEELGATSSGEHETEPAIEEEGGDILLSPKMNTWSRAARRQAARAAAESAEPSEPGLAAPRDDVISEPLFRARLCFVPPTPPFTKIAEQPHAHWRGGTLRLDWTYGKDRGAVDGFWKFVLSKAGLLGAQNGGQGAHGEADEVGRDGQGGGGRGRGDRGGRGGRGRGGGSYGFHTPRGKRGRFS